MAVDDRVVQQRIRSKVFPDVGVSTSDVDVEVKSGFVLLKGAIESIDLAGRLVTRVRRTPGVREVSARLIVLGK